MKKAVISIFSLASVLLFATCTKDLTGLNSDPKNPQIVPSATLFTNAERVITNTLTSSTQNLNIFRLVEQYWQETTYTDESQYDIISRPIPDNLWNSFYRDVLKDFDRSKTLIPDDISDATIQKNDIAIIDIMEVYTWFYLITTYGDVPYSEALNIDNQFPSYDDDQAIYSDLLTRVNADIAALDPSGESFGSADIIYGGDVAAWMKFSNSFKLKLGMLVADADPATAKSTIESAVAAGVFTSNDDNAMFQYLSAPPNTNPVWVDLVQSGRKDYVGNSTFISKLKSLTDPRLKYFYTIDANGDYSGGDPGASSNYATFSKPAVSLTDPAFPGDLLDYSEVEFLLAEAVERGMNVGGTAEDHYKSAIIASIEFWGGTDGEAASYLEQTNVSYVSAAGDWKEKIGTQKWIALYNRGYDAWIETRRLDYPKLPAPKDAQSDFPVRFTYPVNEQNVNTASYDAAAAAIGGDDVTTMLFWDKY